MLINRNKLGTSLAVQWLRLCLKKKKKTLPSSAGGVGSIPGRGARIPHASWPKHKTEALL